MARPVGSTNKISGYARKRLAELDCDPIERAVTCANLMFDAEEYDKAGRIYADIMAYIVPKLKAVDHTSDGKKLQLVEIDYTGFKDGSESGQTQSE